MARNRFPRLPTPPGSAARLTLPDQVGAWEGCCVRRGKPVDTRSPAVTTGRTGPTHGRGGPVFRQPKHTAPQPDDSRADSLLPIPARLQVSVADRPANRSDRVIHKQTGVTTEKTESNISLQKKTHPRAGPGFAVGGSSMVRPGSRGYTGAASTVAGAQAFSTTGRS